MLLSSFENCSIVKAFICAVDKALISTEDIFANASAGNAGIKFAGIALNVEGSKFKTKSEVTAFICRNENFTICVGVSIATWSLVKTATPSVLKPPIFLAVNPLILFGLMFGIATVVNDFT